MMKRGVLVAAAVAAALLMAAAPAAQAATDPVPLLFDPETREEGARQLNKLNSKRAEQYVLRALDRIAEDAEGRRILLRALADAGKAGMRILVRIAGGRQVESAQDAYDILAKKDRLTLVRDSMLKRVKAGKPLSLALFSVDQLVEMRERKVVSLLQKIIESSGHDIELRVAAAKGLGQFGGARVIRFLTLVYQRSRQGVGPKSIDIRRAILDALAHQGGEDVIPTLIDALRAPELWNAAVEALVRLGEPVVPHLKLVLKTNDNEVVPGVLAVLFRLGGVDVSRFLEMLGSADPNIREKARWIMLAFPDPRVVDELAKRWERNSGYPTRAEILDLLVPYYDDPKVHAIFEQALRAEQVELRAPALDMVTGMRDVELAEEILGVAEDDRRPEIRVRAIRALVFLGIFRARGLLERMLQFEDLPVRQEAAWALGWLGAAATTPRSLRATRDYRNDQLLPRVVHTSSRLTRKPRMRNAEPVHYDTVAAFDQKKVYEDVRAETNSIRFGGGRLKVTVMGQGDPILCFSPLPDSDPAAVLKGLKALSTYRKVVLFRREGRPSPPPHKVNPLLRQWMVDAGRAVLKDLGEDDATEVLGWSLGSAWALSYCLDQPNACKKLIVVSPMSLDPGFWDEVPRLLKATLPDHLRADLEYLEVMKDRFSPTAWARYYETLLSDLFFAQPQRGVPLVQTGYPFFIQPAEARFLEVSEGLGILARGGMPVAAVVGQDDLLGTDWVDALNELERSRVTKARVFVTPDSGHLALYENPDKVHPFLVRALRRN